MDSKLLDIIACPKCKSKVQVNQKKDGLVCEKCHLLYPIRNDIPIMLNEEAHPLNKQNTETNS